MDKDQLAKMHSNLWCKDCDDMFVDWIMEEKLIQMDKAYNDEKEKAERVAALALELGASTYISHFQNEQPNHELTFFGEKPSTKINKKRKANAKPNKKNEKRFLTDEEFLDRLVKTIENEDGK